MMDRETIIKLAREAEFHVTGERVQSPVIGGSDLLWLLERFAKLIAEHEREACAKVAEQADNCMNDPYENAAAREIAAAIRARGNT